MQATSVSSAFAAPVGASDGPLAEPEVAALRAALIRVLPDDADRVLNLLRAGLGSQEQAKGITASGRAVARVLNLGGIAPAYLAMLDKLAWRALDALARRCGMALPPTGEMTHGVEIVGVSGRPYFRDPEGSGFKAKYILNRHVEAVYVNLNKQAEFADRKDRKIRIVCRHLALDWIKRRKAHLADAASGLAKGPMDDRKVRERFSNQSVASPEMIAKTLRYDIDLEVSALIRAASNPLEIVYMSQISDFINTSFDRMKVDQHKHYLLYSTAHAMSLELRLKPDEDGGARRVLNFYDPEHTLTSRRVVYDGTQAITLQAEDLFFTPEEFQSYFGDIPHQQVGAFIEVPGSPDRAVIQPSESKAREILVYGPKDVPTGCAPQEVILRVRALAIDGMDEFLRDRVLLSSAGREGNLDRLLGRAPGIRFSALGLAVSARSQPMVTSLVRAARAALDDGRLTPEEFATFLTLNSGQGAGSTSPLSRAMSDASAEGFRIAAILIEEILTAAESGRLPKKTLDAILSPAAIWSAWPRAVKDESCDPYVRQTLATVLQACRAGLLRLDQLTPTDGLLESLCALMGRAWRRNDAPLARTVLSALEQLITERNVSEDQLFAWVSEAFALDYDFGSLLPQWIQAGLPADVFQLLVGAILQHDGQEDGLRALLEETYPKTEQIKSLGAKAFAPYAAAWAEALRDKGAQRFSAEALAGLRGTIGLSEDWMPLALVPQERGKTEALSSLGDKDGGSG